jgi:hypothetical protein
LAIPAWTIRGTRWKGHFSPVFLDGIRDLKTGKKNPPQQKKFPVPSAQFLRSDVHFLNAATARKSGHCFETDVVSVVHGDRVMGWQKLAGVVDCVDGVVVVAEWHRFLKSLLRNIIFFRDKVKTKNERAEKDSLEKVDTVEKVEKVERVEKVDTVRKVWTV